MDLPNTSLFSKLSDSLEEIQVFHGSNKIQNLDFIVKPIDFISLTNKFSSKKVSKIQKAYDSSITSSNNRIKRNCYRQLIQSLFIPKIKHLKDKQIKYENRKKRKRNESQLNTKLSPSRLIMYNHLPTKKKPIILSEIFCAQLLSKQISSLKQDNHHNLTIAVSLTDIMNMMREIEMQLGANLSQIWSKNASFIQNQQNSNNQNQVDEKVSLSHCLIILRKLYISLHLN